MKKILLIIIYSVLSFSSFSQVVMNSPAASEFVKYQRIPVGYFNGLPAIEVPLNTATTKDLQLPISLNYHASGIRVNQYPTCVGLGWNLNAGGCITRVVNGLADETNWRDIFDMSGKGFSDTSFGYYYSSGKLDSEDWASEQRIIDCMNIQMAMKQEIDREPDEFVINAYGLSGSIYFYRNNNGDLCTKVKSNNGEMFEVLTPVMKQDLLDITFASYQITEELKAYKVYDLFYEFTIVKKDGTRLIFGGDYDCIEFCTETRIQSIEGTTEKQFFKTLPTAWMLKEIISPNGVKMSFTYQRDGSPVSLSDVINDLWVYDLNGNVEVSPSYLPDRGKRFRVLHPLYLKTITIDDNYRIDFVLSKSNDLNTMRKEDVDFLNNTGFKEIMMHDVVRYSLTGQSICYEPHDYLKKLDKINVWTEKGLLRTYNFDYIENKSERLKLESVTINNAQDDRPEKYQFKYNTWKLPAYNATLTDNWGFYNNKNYRLFTGDDLYGFRSPNSVLTQAEILIQMTYPTGGKVMFTYEQNDYSKIATQVPDFELLSQSGSTGGIRIKEMKYVDENSELLHSFEYKNEDGTSSGILSGIPRYKTEGGNHISYKFSGWQGVLHFKYEEDLNQRFKLTSENSVNILGMTSGNHVTYSRVIEKIGKEKPLKKIYRYTNHDIYPDTADYAMRTNIDNVALDNKFTSRALMRGLLIGETWYNGEKKVKEISYQYNDGSDNADNYMKCIDQFQIPGVSGYLVTYPFLRFTPYKMLTFYPYLKERTDTIYDPLEETVLQFNEDKFVYNEMLSLTSQESNSSKTGKKRLSYIYPADVCGSGNIYSEMVGRNMTGYPVEVLEYRDGRITGGTLTEYRKDEKLIVPHATFKLGLTEPADSASFFHYDALMHDSRYKTDYEVTDVDASGNPLNIITSDGQTTSYKWGYNSRYPVAKIQNARNTFREYMVYTPIQRTEFIQLNPERLYENEKTYTFSTSQPGEVKIHLSGYMGCDWYVTGNMDGKEFNVVQPRSGDSYKSPWKEYISTYTSRAVFANVPAGEHTLRISATNFNCPTGKYMEPGDMTFSYMGEESVIHKEGCDEWLHESFEGLSGNNIAPFGFHSDQSYTAPYHICLSGESDRKYIVDYQVYKNGKWNYVRLEMDSRNFVINEGLNPIDEVRVYPQDARMESYTYFSPVGMRSVTDGRGITESYGYDSSHRLQDISDMEGSIRKKYTYHYCNQPETDLPTDYTNVAISRNFYSSLCDSTKGEFSQPLKYTVPPEKYVSHISPEDANRMAYEDLLENGQRNADENGICKSYIVISVYNCNSETYLLKYDWGVNGSIQSDYYLIPPSEKVNNIGGVFDDYKPTVIHVERREYRGTSMYPKEDKNRQIDFMISSGQPPYHIRYDRDSYSDYKDTYIVLPQ